ncbi:MAG TPA: class I SAM-dependent methyltransferase, partial [Vicinamibacteria bacterium]|nr:class I SAM-dependent methyltransferase [Vicinamibacteria bacterium]
MPFDPDIESYYAQGGEQARLELGYFPLERARTQEIVLRHLPPPPAVVLDVGGAAGAYALWLAARGYDVHLIDPVPLHVEQASRASTSNERPLASASIGDARGLAREDRSADAVLLLGPLYHLIDRADRLRA